MVLLVTTAVVQLIVGICLGYWWATRNYRGQGPFRVRHRSIDRLADRDRKRAQVPGWHRLVTPPRPQAPTGPRVRVARFARVEETDISRRTGRIREPEDPVR